MDLGHWIYNGEDFDIENWFGFIYRIVENNTSREYIGKKQFFSHRTKSVVGRKNKKHYKKESDWKTYTGSSKELNESITASGKENYTFYIESLHLTKGSLHYEEVRVQIFEDVLRKKLDDGSKKYYNKNIAGIKFIPPSEHSDETKMRQSYTLRKLYENKLNFWYNRLTDEEKELHAEQFLRGDNHPTKRGKTEEEYQSWLDENIRGINNPMHGVEPYNKGKTYEELFGKEETDRIKGILSEKCGLEGENNGFFGKSHTQEQKEKWKNDPRRIKKGEDNGMYGKPCYYNMNEKEKQAWQESISKATKGKPKSEEHAKKIGLAHKGKQKKELTCPHCDFVGRGGNMKRYHFDNCKKKN